MQPLFMIITNKSNISIFIFIILRKQVLASALITSDNFDFQNMRRRFKLQYQKEIHLHIHKKFFLLAPDCTLGPKYAIFQQNIAHTQGNVRKARRKFLDMWGTNGSMRRTCLHGVFPCPISPFLLTMEEKKIFDCSLLVS